MNGEMKAENRNGEMKKERIDYGRKKRKRRRKLTKNVLVKEKENIWKNEFERVEWKSK